MSRINAGLAGCGDEISGPDLMTVMVEDLAGIEIDHYAEVDFEGFIRHRRCLRWGRDLHRSPGP
jgi:anionic cell wall polymer biosynthesis LytR-Cps2A-Psr (LCP) family protein